MPCRITLQNVEDYVCVCVGERQDRAGQRPPQKADYCINETQSGSASPADILSMEKLSVCVCVHASTHQSAAKRNKSQVSPTPTAPLQTSLREDQASSAAPPPLLVVEFRTQAKATNLKTLGDYLRGTSATCFQRETPGLKRLATEG